MLMRMQKQACPVDYRMCNMTVTVYRKEDEAFSRMVYRNAFLDFRKTQTVDKTGSSESNSFLLVIPGDAQAVFVGDKVLLGEGPRIDSQEKWRDFTPVKVSGLVVVKYADPKYWSGRLIHTEAGG